MDFYRFCVAYCVLMVCQSVCVHTFCHYRSIAKPLCQLLYIHLYIYHTFFINIFHTGSKFIYCLLCRIFLDQNLIEKLYEYNFLSPPPTHL